MPFALRGLSVLDDTNGFTLWHYHAINAEEAISVVLEAGYFQNATDMFNPGDRIMVSATDGAVDLYVASVEPLVLVPMARTAAPAAKNE